MVVNELSEIALGHLRGAFQIEGGWKLLLNPSGTIFFDHYELYNVFDDPGETTDLSHEFPELLDDMKMQLQELFKDMVPEDNPDSVDFDICDDNDIVKTGWC